jgi:hypothetical protein
VRLRRAVLTAAAAGAAGFAAGWAAAPRGLNARTDDLDLLLAHFWDEVNGNPDREHWHADLLRLAAGRLQVASWMSSTPSALKRVALAGLPDRGEA